MEDFHFSSQTSVRALYESDHKFVHYQVETPKLEETITPKKWENPVYYFSCHTQTNVKKVFWINDVKLDHTAKEGDAYLSNYEFEQVKLRLSNSKKLDYWILSCLPFVIQLNDLKLPSVDKFVNCTDIPACRTNIMFRKKINWLYKPVPLSYNLSVNEGEDLELKLKFRETMGSTRIYRAKWILDNRTLRNFSMDFDLRVEKIKKPFPGTFHRFTCTYLALYDINFPQKDEHFELGSVDVFVEVKTLPFCEVSITLTKDGQKTRITQPYIEMVEGRQNLEIDCSVNSFATNSGPMLENHRLKHVSPLSGKLLSNDIGSDYTINNYLVIDQLHRNHAGSISCASTDFPYPYGPKVRSVYPLQNPKIGDRVVLECEYESYPRPFEVAWIHHTSGFAKISMQKKLVINEFSSYQYGDYACVISNKFYDENKNLQINTESSRIRAIPSLEDTKCDPPNLEHGYIMLRDHGHEHEAKFYCHIFYRLEGCKSTICNADNVWINLPKCVLVYGAEEKRIMAFFYVLSSSLFIMCLFNVYIWYKIEKIRGYETARLLELKKMKLELWKKNTTEHQMTFLLEASKDHIRRLAKRKDKVSDKYVYTEMED
ncbi:unnamed protein product [Gordionus sp. m RMFG-2023]